MENDQEDDSNPESDVITVLPKDVEHRRTSAKSDEEAVDVTSCEDNVDTEVLSRTDKFKALNAKCERIVTYLKTGKHTPGLTKNQKRLVRAQAIAHIWDRSKKKLYYTGTKHSRKVLVIRDENQVDGIIQDAHVRGDGVHHGINNTATNVASKYFWHSIRQDVVDFVSKCNWCQFKNRGPSRRVKEGSSMEKEEMEDDEDVEFTHDATKALIEAIQKRYQQLSDRSTRSIVYKEVQDELSQLGFCFNKERVRRKWNTLVAMHRRMKREICQNNPPWEYFQMIDGFHSEVDLSLQENEGAAASTSKSQGEATFTNKEKSIIIKQDNDACTNVIVPPTLQGNAYHAQQGHVFSESQENTYPTHQSNSFIVNHGNSYPTYERQTYPSTCHQSGTYGIPQGNNFPVAQGNYTVPQRQCSSAQAQGLIYSPQQKDIITGNKPNTNFQGIAKVTPQNETIVAKKTVPAMFLKIVPDLTGVQSINTQVQPIAVVGALPGQQKDVSQVSNPQIIVNKQPAKQNNQVQNEQDEFLRKQEKLKLKTLMRIERELKNISRIQYNILNKQEEILNAVKNKDTCKQILIHTQEEPEASEPVNKKIKL